MTRTARDAVKVSALLLVFATPIATAQTRIADDLVRSMRLKEQLELGREVCQQKASNLNVEAIQARNPAIFLHIDPTSPIWSDVRQAYIQYSEQICLPVSANDYLPMAASVYSDHLSAEELGQALGFLESPAGRKFVDASEEVTKQVNEGMSVESAKVQRAAWAAYETTLLELRARNPHP